MRERRFIVVLGNYELGEFSGRCVSVGGQKSELKAEPSPGKREHLPELAGTHDADYHAGVAGSG
jgi:hypothetical protein